MGNFEAEEISESENYIPTLEFPRQLLKIYV